MFKPTVIKGRTILRIIGPNGARTGRGAHLLGTVESCEDPDRSGVRVVSEQLMDIDLRRGRVGTHYQDICLIGDGLERWVSLEYVRKLRLELLPPP